MKVEEKEILINKLIQSDRYKKAILGLRRYNHPRGDYEDIVGIFNLGVMQALQVVSSNRGNPMEYLIFRGYAYVRSQLRNECNKTLLEQCTKCGTTRPYRGTKCKCGNKSFHLYARIVNMSSDDGEITVPHTLYPSDFRKTCKGRAKSFVDENLNII